MKTLSASLAVLVLLTLGTVCQAGVITGAEAADDGDGAAVCTGVWDELEQAMNIDGKLKWSPAHIGSEDLDDTAYFAVDGDPTAKVRTTIDNATGYAWTSFLVNIYADQAFTLSSPTVYTPDTSETGWYVASLGSYPMVATGPVGGKYTASVTFMGGTAIPSGTGVDHDIDAGTLDFSYKLTFGATIHYCQEMIPTPEPSALVLAFGGLVGLLVVRRKFAR
jgi:hypothetical protein